MCFLFVLFVIWCAVNIVGFLICLDDHSGVSEKWKRWEVLFPAYRASYHFANFFKEKVIPWINGDLKK